jgi:pyruvate/2-oxoglutarate dehydrogenase complex dihydrolipoamide acyltransferase (E2) component
MLGIGRATKAPCWMKESFVPRDVMKVVLSLDHRMLDGRYGAQFLESLKSILEGNYLNHIFK